MFVTIINDCQDENAKMRLATRTMALFGCPVTAYGVADDIEAAGFLVDALDAALGEPSWILINVAPRTKENSSDNGSPFCYFEHFGTRVISTVEGWTLSLLCYFGIEQCQTIQLDDKMVNELVDVHKTSHENPLLLAARLKYTQFRSLEVQMRLAKLFSVRGMSVFEQSGRLRDHPVHRRMMPGMVWFVDNFGNIKTSWTKKHLSGWGISTDRGVLPYYGDLRSLPQGELGLVEGSSGLGVSRFLEIALKGGRASDMLRLKVGDKIERIDGVVSIDRVVHQVGHEGQFRD